MHLPKIPGALTVTLKAHRNGPTAWRSTDHPPAPVFYYRGHRVFTEGFSEGPNRVETGRARIRHKTVSSCLHIFPKTMPRLLLLWLASLSSIAHANDALLPHNYAWGIGSQPPMQAVLSTRAWRFSRRRGTSTASSTSRTRNRRRAEFRAFSARRRSATRASVITTEGTSRGSRQARTRRKTTRRSGERCGSRTSDASASAPPGWRWRWSRLTPQPLPPRGQQPWRANPMVHDLPQNGFVLFAHIS